MKCIVKRNDPIYEVIAVTSENRNNINYYLALNGFNFQIEKDENGFYAYEIYDTGTYGGDMPCGLDGMNYILIPPKGYAVEFCSSEKLYNNFSII